VPGLPLTNRLDPALSGDGRWLASISEQGGGARVILQRQSDGGLQPLRHLNGQTPHHSPSLSWNGRYLAALVQRGQSRLIVVEDRLSGRLHHLPISAGTQPERVSLSPDASRLAIQGLRQGRWQIQLYSLNGVLEPDLPGGNRVLGGGPQAR
jgi:Tol biopolymer transport system component